MDDQDTAMCSIVAQGFDQGYVQCTKNCGRHPLQHLHNTGVSRVWTVHWVHTICHSAVIDSGSI